MALPLVRVPSRHFSALIPMMGLLLIYLVSRLHDVLAMPPFIDEVTHIRWAQDVCRGHLFTAAADGRVLAVWWLSLFQLSGDNLLWITRTATLLFSMISVAVLYNLGRIVASRWAGLLAAVFYILAPFTFFYDRLGMSDIYVSTLGILVMWFSVRFVIRGRRLDALAAGLILAADLAVKATALMLIFIPTIVLVTLIPYSRWRQILRGGIWAYGAYLVTTLPFVVLLRVRGFTYFSDATTLQGTSNVSGIIPRLLSNLGAAWTIDTVFLTPVLIVLTIVLSVYLILRKPRTGLMLILCTLVPLVALMAFAISVRGRYIVLHIPMLIECLAVSLAVLAIDLSRRGALPRAAALTLTAAVPILGGILFALPFQAQMRTDPAAVSLPNGEWAEYVKGDSSGFALDQAAAYLIKIAAQDKQPIHIVGLVANCGALDLQIPTNSGVTVECPYITFTGSMQKTLAALVNKQAADSIGPELWLVAENSPYITLDGITAPYDKVISFDRPGGVSQVSLYRVRKPGS